jgi:hypothetical protein
MEPVAIDLAQWLQHSGFEASFRSFIRISPASGLSDDRRSAH